MAKDSGMSASSEAKETTCLAAGDQVSDELQESLEEWALVSKPTEDGEDAATASRPIGDAATNPRLVIGVDLGVAFTDIAYARQDDGDLDPTVASLSWPGPWASAPPFRRIPSIVYYNKRSEVVGGGLDTDAALAPTGRPRTGIVSFGCFVLHFFNGGQTGGGSRSGGREAPEWPVDVPGFDVVVDFLLRVRKSVEAGLRPKFPAAFANPEEHIDWCFTVPSYADDFARRAFRSAILKAGFVRDVDENRLAFITKAEANIHWASSCNQVSLCQNGVVLCVSLGEADTTLTTHGITGVAPLAFGDAATVTRSIIGADNITQNFSDLLTDQLKKMRLPQDSSTKKLLYRKTMMGFRHNIKPSFANSGQEWGIDIGMEAEFLEAGIYDGEIHHSNDEIRSCFDPVVEELVALIQEHMRHDAEQGKQVEYILLAGGLAENRYVFDQLQARLPTSLHGVLCVKDGALAAARGAVVSRLDSK